MEFKKHSSYLKNLSLIENLKELELKAEKA